MDALLSHRITPRPCPDPGHAAASGGKQWSVPRKSLSSVIGWP